MGLEKVLKLSVLLLALVGVQASAATVSYYLDQSNDLLDGINYVQVTISDGSGGDIDFSVEVLTSAFSVSPDANFGMQNFSFNYNTLNVTSISKKNIDIVFPATWKISQDTGAGGGFGKFEFQLSGNGGSRTELLSFSINDIAGDTISDYAIGSTLSPSSGEFFATHIAGFDAINGVTSAQFSGSTSVVPVPAAVWLFGSGLFLLGFAGVAKRKEFV